MERVINQLFHLTEIVMRFSFFQDFPPLAFYHWPGDILNGTSIQPIPSPSLLTTKPPASPLPLAACEILNLLCQWLDAALSQ